MNVLLYISNKYLLLQTITYLCPMFNLPINYSNYD